MFPVEQVCYIETHHYKIVEHLMVTFPDEIQGFLILDEDLNKYNYYITHYFINYDPEQIIKNFSPQSLEEAQKTFPKYSLNEGNYGFNSL